MNSNECHHTVDERCFNGTFCTPELHESLKKGYTILETYEIYEFEMTEGLFKDYVNTFLQLKQESSGFPSYCTTEQEKQKYIEEYAPHEGINLNYNSISENPGLRYIAKLFLNSLFGKFAQRTDLTQTRIVNDAKSFLEILHTPHFEVQSVLLIGENSLLVTYKDNENANTPFAFSNVILSAFITSWARLKLYELLEKVGKENLIYSDTDSVFHAQKRNEPLLLPTGNFLGNLTNEIKEGWEIPIFIGLGPKNYSYKEKEIETEKVKYCYKIRGITLNFRARQIINFEHFYNLV